VGIWAFDLAADWVLLLSMLDLPKCHLGELLFWLGLAGVLCALKVLATSSHTHSTTNLGVHHYYYNVAPSLVLPLCCTRKPASASFASSVSRRASRLTKTLGTRAHLCYFILSRFISTERCFVSHNFYFASAITQPFTGCRYVRNFRKRS